jgi:uncharacterized repeat protein (TIGR03803 family)
MTSMFRLAAITAASACAVAAQAATFTVLHTFAGSDGASPMAALAQDGAGNLYGTTYSGGAAGFGTLFKYDGVQLTTLHAFSGGTDGGYPEGSLLADGEGNLYGTTKVGGGGYGTVFRWDREQSQHLRTVKAFIDRAADGVWPIGGLARDADGTLYGNTFYGGNMSCGTPGLGCGTIFRITATGAFSQLHRFGGTEGYGPNPTLLRLGDRLWGGTVYGGPSPAGGPFSMKTDGSAFAAVTPTALAYNFIGGHAADAAGNLYGVAFSGGAHSMGSIYRIDTSGHFTIVHDFGGSDGAFPTGTPVMDARGMLYGTTQGASTWGNELSGPGGWGTVWQFDTHTGTLTTLHQFTGGDGKNPLAGVVRDAEGALYGVTSYGGTADKGVLYRVTP